MNPTTISRLLELNRQFYQSFAHEFSATRHRLQPGVKRILDQIKPEEDVLDLGCGNGELARALYQRGHTGSYTGLDFSPALLELARASQPKHYQFQLADLSGSNWDALLDKRHFDTILAFAVLHHLPGENLRMQTFRKAGTLLVSGGRLIHAEWQFLNSPRLTSRIQSWKVIGLTENDVDPDDYLLDWRQGGRGLRYVHYYSEQELEQLAAICGFTILESFLSDGENGRLGLYQVWKLN